MVIGPADVSFSSEEAPSMEYLVAMTTRVPDGTPEQAVDDVRAREAAHSRDLAAAGHLLRLWRPPLRPGEWRTFGLFAAASDDELEKVLASMPLRIWRTDEVTPLAPHPNDPSPPPAPGPPEFLTYFTVVVPAGTPDAVVAGTDAAEAAAARELAGQGHLLRLWRLPPGEPGEPGALGLWRAADAAELRAIVRSLPLDAWMRTDITPLSIHPSDPALAAS
ncbi:MAG: muconolactone Delta-isomerase family protein [Streptosporangiaceae bacterium]